MSDFKFSCPKCGQSILCDASNAGMQIPCPACSTLLTVPAPPPPEPAAPAKLGISKTAHVAHHPPPPGAANAPNKPTWGQKTAPALAARKKSGALKTSLILAGVAIVLAVGWFVFGAPALKDYQDKQKQKQEEADRLAAEQARAAAEAAKPKPPKAAWKLDLADVKFPDRPAEGKIHGGDFKVEKATLQGGVLTLRQETGTLRQFVIGLPFKPGETMAGKSFEVVSTNLINQPHVNMFWRDDMAKPAVGQAFAKGYAMKLEFGDANGGQVSGNIFLCVPDPEQSFVAGNFTIGTAVAAGPRAGQPGAPPREKKSKKAASAMDASGIAN